VTLPERDWRLLRSVHRAALDRYCARVLEECATVIRDTTSCSRDRYLRLFRLVKERDESIAAAFDDLRRSTAIQRLASMILLGAITDEELSQFTSRLANRQPRWQTSAGQPGRPERGLECTSAAQQRLHPSAAARRRSRIRKATVSGRQVSR
jgi:hypothetical protein